MLDLLGLPSIASVSSEENAGRLIVTARVVEQPLSCPACGRTPCYKHDSRDQEYADAPIRGMPVRIRITRRRYRCPDCTKTFFEPLAGFSAKREMTRRLVYLIGRKSLIHSFADVAREMALDVQTIRDVFFDFAEYARRILPLPTPRVMGIDEAKRAGELRTVLTNLEERTYFDLLPSYKLPALREYLVSLPDRSKVEVVAMDLSNVFEMAIREHMPKAVIVADKYHVVRMANEALEAVHRKVRKPLPKGERLALFRQRGVMSTRAHRLDHRGQRALEEIGSRYPLLALAHKVKEDLYAIYDAPSRVEATARMDEWLAALPPELQTYFKRVAAALTTRREHILNYFEHRYTNAFTESVNGVSKMMQRRGKRYGFEVMRLKLLYGKRAMKIKEQEFIVAQEEAERPAMGDAIGYAMWGKPITARRVKRRVLVGPECARVAKLADEGYYESGDIEPLLDEALKRFAEHY
jgi:transposase